MKITDTNTNRKTDGFALFALGFRPFFLGGGLYAVCSVAVWFLMLGFSIPVNLQLPALSWHAHEMLYGYTMAVIAGFLLTAVRNWTGYATPTGLPLAGLFMLWLAARIMPYLPFAFALPLMALFDLLFSVALVVAVTVPVVRAKAWRQLAIIGKVMLLLVGNALFYAGLFGWWQVDSRFGLYFGLYLIVALILTMARRVIPFFTERGAGYVVTLVNRRWLDISSIVIFLVFFICDLFIGEKRLAAVSALILFVLHTVRLYGWYTRGIWRKPLLWSLYAGYAFITAGFLLYALAVFTGVSPFAAVHAFTYGGIGMLTLSMMSRVALGHTGRDVHEPSRYLNFFLVVLVFGTVSRIFPVLYDPLNYLTYIVLSQVLWMLAFGGFVWIYTPVLIRPRVDGQPG